MMYWKDKTFLYIIHLAGILLRILNRRLLIVSLCCPFRFFSGGSLLVRERPEASGGQGRCSASSIVALLSAVRKAPFRMIPPPRFIRHRRRFGSVTLHPVADKMVAYGKQCAAVTPYAAANWIYSLNS